MTLVTSGFLTASARAYPTVTDIRAQSSTAGMRTGESERWMPYRQMATSSARTMPGTASTVKRLNVDTAWALRGTGIDQT